MYLELARSKGKTYGTSYISMVTEVGESLVCKPVSDVEWNSQLEEFENSEFFEVERTEDSAFIKYKIKEVAINEQAEIMDAALREIGGSCAY